MTADKKDPPESPKGRPPSVPVPRNPPPAPPKESRPSTDVFKEDWRDKPQFKDGQ